MSAEREVFKQMDALYDEKVAFADSYKARGMELVQKALQEFMCEHPEVQTLTWDDDDGVPGLFGVVIDGGLLTAEELVDTNPQLSKCLAALEEKFAKLGDLVFAEGPVAVAIVRFKEGAELRF